MTNFGEYEALLNRLKFYTICEDCRNERYCKEIYSISMCLAGETLRLILQAKLGQSSGFFAQSNWINRAVPRVCKYCVLEIECEDYHCPAWQLLNLVSESLDPNFPAFWRFLQNENRSD